MSENRPPLDPHPLSEYVAWAGGRNREPILGVLKEKLPKAPGRVLELASGSGMHINYFAPHFEHLHFHPSDKDKEVFDNIKKLRSDHSNDNIADPVHLDLTDPATWFNPGTQKSFDAIFCINIFQVAPVSIADGMMECASHLLTDDGMLLIYGPFKVEGSFTTDSNKEFHETLSSAGVAEWGLKDVADLKQAAGKHGMELKEIINMPANNFSLIFGRK
jgi:cyclopropane fatty-acyl-phospholipid synthase-like methyltransferase